MSGAVDWGGEGIVHPPLLVVTPCVLSAFVMYSVVSYNIFRSLFIIMDHTLYNYTA